MAFALGTATGRIEIEYDGSGVDKAKKDTEGLNKQAAESTKGLKTLSNTAGVAGLAIAGGLGAAVNAAANFEQRMSAIGAVSGASGKEMDQLRDKALQLGKDTQFSATESASAIEELIKAGLSVSDVLNGAADATVNLAAAGEVAMPEAAAISSNAMNQFNLTAKDMVGVVDSIAGAANASAIDVSEFGFSLQQVGAVAHLAGVSFDDTATAIALMGNAGIKGSDAGTSLKAMFSRLIPTTDKTVQEMMRLHLITFDNQKAMDTLRKNGVKPLGNDSKTLQKQMEELGANLSGSKVGSAKAEKAYQRLALQSGALHNAFYTQNGDLKSLDKVAGTLQDSLKGMNKEQKQATLQTLFGSDAIRAAAILSNNGAKGFDKMAASMKKVSAADVAKKRMDNFKGSLEQMKGSLETAGIALGTILLPALRNLVDFITKLLNWFLNLSDAQQKWILAIIGAIGAVLLIVAGIAKLIIFINTFQAALVALRGTMVATWAAALGPVALVIAIIAALVIAIVILWKKSETFRKIVTGAWNGLKAAVKAVADWFMNTLVPFMASVWDGIKKVVTTVLSVIVGVVMTYFNIYKTIIMTVLNVIMGIWNAVWGTFGPAIKAVFGLILAIINLAWTVIKGVFLLNLILIKNIVMSVFHTIAAAVRAAMNVVRAIIRAVWGFIGPYVKTAVNAIKTVVVGVWNAIKKATSATWGALKGIIKTAIGAAKKIIDGIKDKVLSPFKDAATWLIHAGEEIINGLVHGIEKVAHKVTDKIKSITDKVSNFLPGSPVKEGPLRVLNHGYAGKQIIGMIVDGMDTMAPALTSALDTYASSVPQTVTATTVATAVATPAGKEANGLRFIKGSVELKNGRAYIQGIAEEVVDSEAHHHASSNRRGRR